MSIEFSCPNCSKAYRVKDELAGKSARCACGQQIKVPTPAPQPAADLSDLLEELEDPLAQVAEPQAPLAKRGTKAQKSATKIPGYGALGPLGDWLENTGSAAVKLLIGAAAGAFCGMKAIARDKGSLPMERSQQILIVLGAAIAGAIAASLLVVADVVRTRVAQGKPVPLPLRLYFASKWLSLILWIATVFAAVILWLILFEGMQ